MRWIEPEGWELTRGAFFKGLPAPLSWIIPPMSRRGMQKELHGHGMGRHSLEEVHALGCRDLSALADFLGDKPFMMGEQPSSLDAVAYGFLANLLWVPLESSVKAHAQDAT